MTPEELLAELRNDPALKPHLEKALTNVVLAKQTQMFQEVQQRLAEAEEELARRR